MAPARAGGGGGVDTGVGVGPGADAPAGHAPPARIDRLTPEAFREEVARLLAEEVAECAGLADIRRRGYGTLTISLHWKRWRLEVAAARVDSTRTPGR
jgi:hypothetical protein